MSPLVAAFFSVLVEVLPKLFELFEKGGRDAVLTALDTALVVARAKTDADLLAKHKDDPA